MYQGARSKSRSTRNATPANEAAIEPVPTEENPSNTIIKEIIAANKCATHPGAVCTLQKQGKHLAMSHHQVVFWASTIVSIPFFLLN